MPEALLQGLPPLKAAVDERTVARVVRMREQEKKTFGAIGKELKLTAEKAERVYQMFYHQKLMALIDALERMVHSPQEKASLSACYVRGYKSAKKRYELLIQELERQEHEKKTESVNSQEPEIKAIGLIQQIIINTEKYTIYNRVFCQRPAAFHSRRTFSVVRARFLPLRGFASSKERGSRLMLKAAVTPSP